MRHRVAALAAFAIAAASCASNAGVATVESERFGSDPPTTDVGDESAATLEWTPCPGDVVVEPLDCATLTVPVDHGRPDGETIEIALARKPAGDPDRRIGSLVLNPGGPGASGVDFLELIVAAIPFDVAERFDLVSFDPRGVGASSAVDCDIVIDDNVTLLADGDDAGWAELVAQAESLPSMCPVAARELAPYVGTNNAARDLDLVREALGDERLTYVGFSYGTRLGATYAELFPGRVRALVLDGAVRPTTDFAALDREQVDGFDRALASFAEACDDDADCVLRDVGPTLDVIADLGRQVADTGGLSTDDPARDLTPGELQLGIAAALYSKVAWPLLAEGLYLAATSGDGSLMHALVDSYVGRQADGTYDNSTEANLFINCADDPARPAYEEIRAAGEASAEGSTYFDDLMRADTGCIGTPDPIDPLIVGPAAGAPPILVIGSTGDPATPYEWSVALADFLDSAVLYTVEAEGHTAYTSIDCVEAVVGAYLIELTVPAPGSSCSDNDDADFFPPPGESEFDRILALFDCLRDNGADIPELTVGDLVADPTGETILEYFDMTDPAFVDAALACSDLLEDLGG